MRIFMKKKKFLCVVAVGVFLTVSGMTSLLSYFLSIFRRAPRVRKAKVNIPLPKVVHLELTADDIRNRRVFVIGDVHGCYDELAELLDKASEKHRDVLFIFVGDLVNKGPKSKQVMELVRSLDCFAVRGNHDDEIVYQYLRSSTDPNYSLHERFHWMKELPVSDFEFLMELPYTITIPSLSAIIVHAGLVPGLKVEGQELTTFTHMRNIEETFSLFHGSYPMLTPLEHTKSGVPWASIWPGPEHVYFGHDAVRRLQIYPFATGLDSGCVYGKSLTGRFVDGAREIIHVKSRQPDRFYHS